LSRKWEPSQRRKKDGGRVGECSTLRIQDPCSLCRTRIATFFVSTLIGSTILAGILATVPILLHFYYLVPKRTTHRTYITDNVSAWLFWAAANVLISWWLAVAVNILPHVVTWFVAVSWGTVSESFKSNIALYGAFKGWIKPVLYAAR